VLWQWIPDHEACLARQANTPQFDVVTAVPSASNRADDHPLRAIVADIVGPTKERFADLVEVNPNVVQGREPSDDRWLCTDLDGESVLLIDDTWTTGAHAQSAVAALRLAGAEKVATLVIGRHFSRQQGEAAYSEAAEEYYKQAKALRWSWDHCQYDRD
jgi:hypothetical protein